MLGAEALVEARDEVVDEEGDVLAALAERGDGERHHVEPEVQVFAEAPGLALLLQVAGAGGHHAHLGLAVVRLAQPSVRRLLQHPKELHLEPEGQVGYLVEEERAAVGLLEEPALVGVGVGEGALLVPKQLALDEVFGNRPAVDRDEGLRRAGRAVVDGPRHQLLADARLARDEHGGLEVGHAGERREEGPHGLGAGHEAVEAVLPTHGSAQLAVLPHEHLALLHLAQGEGEVGRGEGLGEVVCRAALDGRQGVLVGAVGAHHHHHHVGVLRAELFHQLEPRAARHTHVGDHKLHRVARHRGEGLVDAPHGQHLPPLLAQVGAQGEPEVFFIVDEQQLGHRGTAMKCTPRPSAHRTTFVPPQHPGDPEDVPTRLAASANPGWRRPGSVCGVVRGEGACGRLRGDGTTCAKAS
jgi:hypothetical protein